MRGQNTDRYYQCLMYAGHTPSRFYVRRLAAEGRGDAELRRTLLPGTSVNMGKKKGQSCYAPALLSCLLLV